MPARPSYSDAQLTEAVANAHSWRGVLRSVGLTATSAGAVRSARRHADRLGLSYAHFTGQRTWRTSELVQAVAASQSWQEVLATMGLAVAGGNMATVRGHARRLGLDVEHLNRIDGVVTETSVFTADPDKSMLRFAAPSLAAAWFQLRGYAVLWPEEGRRYDLVVQSDQEFLRIQVKTATRRLQGSVLAPISATRNDRHSAYDVGELDQFFIVTDDLDAYLIPYDVVAGRQQISMNRYRNFRVAERGQWLSSCASREP